MCHPALSANHPPEKKVRICNARIKNALVKWLIMKAHLTKSHLTKSCFLRHPGQSEVRFVKWDSSPLDKFKRPNASRLRPLKGRVCQGGLARCLCEAVALCKSLNVSQGQKRQTLPASGHRQERKWRHACHLTRNCTGHLMPTRQQGHKSFNPLSIASLRPFRFGAARAVPPP